MKSRHLQFIIKHWLRSIAIAKAYLKIKHYFVIAKRRYYLFPLFLRKSLPVRYLLIELSSVCNLNCKWCIIERKKRGFMDLALFEDILQLIAKKEIICKEISLNGGGEMLLHPKFKKALDIISKVKTNNKKFPLVTLITNATLLTKGNSAAILNSNAIDIIRFSIDGGTKEEFEKIRINAKWENAIKHINIFIDLNNKKGKPVHTSIISIINPAVNLSAEFNKLIGRIDEYLPRRAHYWTGEKEFEDLPKTNNPNSSFCENIFTTALIHWNGLVSPCCLDLNTHCIIGNIKKEDLKDMLYNGKKWEIIKDMYFKKREKHVLCAKCCF